MEINTKGIDKGFAVKWMCDYLKIDIKDTMAIGDNYNDVSMIETAGVGIVVANGNDDVKKIASYVCEKTNRSGPLVFGLVVADVHVAGQVLVFPNLDIAVALFKEVYCIEDAWRDADFFIIVTCDDVNAFVIFAFGYCKAAIEFYGLTFFYFAEDVLGKLS